MEEIQEKAVAKACRNGWKGSPYLDYDKLVNESWRSDMIMGQGIWLVAIVYSPPHDFAKALWGEARDIKSYKHILEGEYFDDKTPEEYEAIVKAGEDQNHWEEYIPVYKNKGWKYHLMQMVIAEDPIEYLGDNL